ncbi:MAG: hypothetical protein Fur0032_24390 [Terrimicrobiaceae bacterium]
MTTPNPTRGTPPRSQADAFTMVELLLVIAVIGVMSALVITTIGNATKDSNEVIARQQQVVLQEALNAWIARQASGTGSLATASNAYTAASDKLALLTNYMGGDPGDSARRFRWTNGRVESDALLKAGKYLQFSSWAPYPYVSLSNQ